MDELLKTETLNWSSPCIYLDKNSGGLSLVYHGDLFRETFISWTIVNSPTCCGLLEIGNFIYGNSYVVNASDWKQFKQITQKYWKQFILVNCVTSYLPKKGWKNWEEFLLELGFVKGIIFYNPNTNNMVYQYTWIREKNNESKT